MKRLYTFFAGMGGGVAVGHGTTPLLALTSVDTNQVAVYACRGDSVDRRFTFGKTGTGDAEFLFTEECGWVAFVPGEDSLLISDSGNGRVQEFRVHQDAPVLLGTVLRVANPRGVAASADLIAVASRRWVHLVNGRTRQIQRVVSLGTDLHGLCFTKGGSGVVVATSEAFAALPDVCFCRAQDVTTDATGEVMELHDDCITRGDDVVVQLKTWNVTRARAVACTADDIVFVREGRFVHCFATAHAHAKACMSLTRVAWLGCAVRAAARIPFKPQLKKQCIC